MLSEVPNLCSQLPANGRTETLSRREKALAFRESAIRDTRRASREMPLGVMKDVALTPASSGRAAATTTAVVGTRAELPELYGESPPKTGSAGTDRPSEG